MDTNINNFCTMIDNRSTENRRAMQCFANLHSVLSPAFSILRQELDSMIRVIYLLEVTDQVERERLICATLRGDGWTVSTVKGKSRKITDREMVDVAEQLQGWVQSVYKFGCAFVHLSDFHNHLAENPFQKLSAVERHNILAYMRHYHGGPSRDDPDMGEISKYLPKVFDKISDNLEWYVGQLRGQNPEHLC